MRNRLQACVALLLLLGAATDLLVPGICTVEEPRTSREHVVMAESHRDLTGSPDIDTAWADDCFCCCAHVVPGRLAQVLPAIASLDLTHRLLPPLVDGPPDRVLHPPRA